MTVVAINAISVREGGSLVVLRELLRGMAALRPQWRWYVVVNSAVAVPLPDLPNLEYRRFSEVDQSGMRTRVWYETGLPRLLKSVSADLLFSMTNYLPRRRMPCQTLLLVQHAGHFSHLFRQLTEARLGLLQRMAWRLKGHWVRSSVRAADVVVVQTHALALQIAPEAGVSLDKMRVVPHGTGQAIVQARPVAPPAQDERFRVGYITKYGVQKNFAVLFEALALLKDKGVLLSMVVTLSPAHRESREILELAASMGLAGIIENHGELQVNELGRIYQTLHAFAFPSLCESFGFPMVEAMAYGIPLIVLDIDSNVEVAGSGGKSFPAGDPESLACELDRLRLDADWFRFSAQASLARAADFEWARAAAGTVALMDELVCDGRSDSACEGQIAAGPR